MFVTHVSSAFVASVLFMFFLAGATHAQEKKDVAKDTLRSLLPKDTGGTQIKESDMTMAYVGAVVGFVIVFALAWAFVRVFAFIVVAGCFLGGIAGLCLVINEQWVTTWEQLGVTIAMVGGTAGVIAVTANLFLIRGGLEGSEKTVSEKTALKNTA